MVRTIRKMTISKVRKSGIRLWRVQQRGGYAKLVGPCEVTTARGKRVIRDVCIAIGNNNRMGKVADLLNDAGVVL